MVYGVEGNGTHMRETCVMAPIVEGIEPVRLLNSELLTKEHTRSHMHTYRWACVHLHA